MNLEARVREIRHAVSVTVADLDLPADARDTLSEACDVLRVVGELVNGLRSAAATGELMTGNTESLVQELERALDSAE
jgi:hypothetical protein